MTTHFDLRLSQGQTARVDVADADRVCGRRWYAVRHPHGFYAATSINGRRMYLHRYLMGLGRGRKLVVDHVNHDGLDNRRANLRVCTPSINSLNRRCSKIGSPDYAGVFKAGNRWGARVKYERGSIYLGIFASEELAGIACAAAKRTILHITAGGAE